MLIETEKKETILTPFGMQGCVSRIRIAAMDSQGAHVRNGGGGV